MSPHRPFDAVLLVSFGGPQSRDEIRPFLANVLRGRSVPPARLDAVVHHYEMFNGVSPLTAITMRQADGLRERLTRDRLPVYVGMRNWHPFLEDTLKEMSNTGMRHALALTLSAQHSYSSCGQYKQNVTQARDAIHQTSHADIAVTYVAGWHEHPGFIEANVRQIERALVELPSQLQPAARLVFTAHSIPDSMAAESRYVAELRESAVLIAKRLGRDDWALVFQSRSGSPQDPWLEPDICDYIRAEREHGLDAIVVSPIGFVADHIEVLVRSRPRGDENLSPCRCGDESGCLGQRRAGLPRYAGRCHPYDLPTLRHRHTTADSANGTAVAHGATTTGALVLTSFESRVGRFIPRGGKYSQERNNCSPLYRSRESRFSDSPRVFQGDTATKRGRLAGRHRRAVFIERRRQVTSDTFGFLILDLMTLHYVDKLAITKQCDRRRRWRISGKVAASSLRSLNIGSSKHRRNDVWLERMLKG